MRTALFCALFVLAAPLSSAQIALPVTFEDGDAAFYELNDFEGNTSQVIADPTDATNMVVESVRGIGAGVPAGTTVADVSGFTAALPFAEGATTMSVRVWTPAAGTPVRLKVEQVGVPSVSVETQVLSTMAGAWETLVFNFANEVSGTAALNFASTYDKATIFFNFGQAGATEATTYYWDDVAFGGDAGPVATPIADVRAAGAGMEFTISGVVTRAMGDFSYVQDATGALTVRQTSGDYFDAVAAGTIAAGTQVTITGTTSEFRGLFQINGDDLTSYSVTGTVGVPAAQAVTVADFLANGESYEAELVEISGLTTSETGAFAAGTNYTVTDGAGDATLRVPNEDDSMVDGTDIPEGAFTFTGVVGQFTFADPATDGYQLLAIATGDVEVDPVPVVSLPVTFEDDINYELQDFGGNTSQLITDPTDSENTVVESVRAADAACFAGTTVADVLGFTAPIPFAEGATTMSVRVWSPESGIRVLLKVEDVDNGGIFVETLATTTMAGAWDTLVFDFSNPMPNPSALNFASTYTKASIFFDFSCDLDPAPPASPVRTYYWDDVSFGGDAGPVATPIADVRAAGPGMEFTISGVVTRAMGDFSYVQDATGALTVRQTSGDYFDAVAAGTIAAGTQVTITGTTSEFRGLFQINGDDLTDYSVSGVVGVPAAQAVTVADLTANGESYEAELVEISGLTTTETGAFAAGTNYTVTDGAGDATLRVPNEDDSMVDGTDIPEGAFTFTGVVGQFTFSDPATDGYQLLAIAPGDVEAVPVPVVSLPVRFEDDIDYELNDFGGTTSQLIEDPTDSENTVVETVRGVGAADFAGTTVADVAGFTARIPFAEALGSTTMNVKVWTPVAGTPVRLKVEQAGVPEVSVEAQVVSTLSGAWEVLVFDFANQVGGTAALNFASTYTKASVFFNFGETGATEATTYYWDDVAFGSEAPVSQENGSVSDDLKLAQNAPNPFSDQTTIRFTIPAQDHVQVMVYNHLGQHVATLVDSMMGAGSHAVPFDASELASGTYFYRLSHGSESETRSMILVR